LVRWFIAAFSKCFLGVHWSIGALVYWFILPSTASAAPNTWSSFAAAPAAVDAGGALTYRGSGDTMMFSMGMKQ